MSLMREVSDVAAFVMANGSLAEELLRGEDELPGISKEEREALDRVMDHLEETWTDILLECRGTLWKLSSRTALGKTLRQSPNRRSRIWERGVEMPLVVGRSWEASCGFNLEVWEGNPKYALRGWVWTQARYRDAARNAVAGVKGLYWNGRTHWLDFGTPKAGESFSAMAAEAAQGLWVITRPIGEAVHANRRKKK